MRPFSGGLSDILTLFRFWSKFVHPNKSLIRYSRIETKEKLAYKILT